MADGWDAMKLTRDRESLLLDQLPLVQYVARQIYYHLPKHVVFDDLLQAGMLGLLDACMKYDFNRHVPFGTYAKIRIRGSILDSLRELDLAPRSLRRFARQAEQARVILRGTLAREPVEAEVAAHLKIPFKKFQSCLRELDCLATTSPRLDNWENFLDQAKSPQEQSPDHIHLRTELTDQLRTLIAQLPNRQRELLSLYYEQDLTMKEVGAVLGIGEARVSQLHSLAIRGLRERLQDLESVGGEPERADRGRESLPGAAGSWG